MPHRPVRHAIVRRSLVALLLAPVLTVPSSGGALAEDDCYLTQPGASSASTGESTSVHETVGVVGPDRGVPEVPDASVYEAVGVTPPDRGVPEAPDAYGYVDQEVAVPDRPAPDVPDVPEVPDVPDVPDVPEVPEVPDLPEVPGVSGYVEDVTGSDLFPCPSVADLTNSENLPGAPMICTDYENGCDKRYIDRTDPFFATWDFEVPPGSEVAENTNSFPRDPARGSFTAVGLTVKDHDGSAMDEGGVVGYGLALPTQAARYQPCSQAKDPYNGACLNPGGGGYLAAKNFYAGGGSNFGSGLFVGNYSKKADCPSPCKHWWGQRTGRIDVEIYGIAAGRTDVQHVRPRFAQFSNQFTIHANGGTYGTPVGDVRVRRIGNPGVVRLAGFIARAGVRVGAAEAQLRMFQVGSGDSSSNGQGLQSFATPGTNVNGYYDTGAIYAGTYNIKAYDERTGVCRMRPNTNLPATGRIDLDLSNQNDFGQGFNRPCK